MKVEVIDFYPRLIKDNKSNIIKYIGTISLYLIDYKIDLRGILVKKRKKKLFICLPGKIVTDTEINEKGEKIKKNIFYQYFSFQEIEKQKDLIKSCQIETAKYIYKYFIGENYEIRKCCSK